jgi:hypothetical protein
MACPKFCQIFSNGITRGSARDPMPLACCASSILGSSITTTFTPKARWVASCRTSSGNE